MFSGKPSVVVFFGRNSKTITNITFMGGLALGRLVSLALDGVPGIYFLIGFMLEAVLAIWGLKNLKKYGTD